MTNFTWNNPSPSCWLFASHAPPASYTPHTQVQMRVYIFGGLQHAHKCPSDLFQMKKHMQDLSNKISGRGLQHNELWDGDGRGLSEAVWEWERQHHRLMGKPVFATLWVQCCPCECEWVTSVQYVCDFLLNNKSASFLDDWEMSRLLRYTSDKTAAKAKIQMQESRKASVWVWPGDTHPASELLKITSLFFFLFSLLCFSRQFWNVCICNVTEKSVTSLLLINAPSQVLALPRFNLLLNECPIFNLKPLTALFIIEIHSGANNIHSNIS